MPSADLAFLRRAAAVLAMVAAGIDKAGWTLQLFVLVQQFEGNLLLPLLQRRITRLPSAVALFSLVAFGLLFGLFGVVVATPCALLILLAARRLPPSPL